MDQFRCPSCKRMVALGPNGRCATCGAAPATLESLGPAFVERLLARPERAAPDDDPMQRFIHRSAGWNRRRLAVMLAGILVALAIWGLCIQPRYAGGLTEEAPARAPSGAYGDEDELGRTWVGPLPASATPPEPSPALLRPGLATPSRPAAPPRAAPPSP